MSTPTVTLRPARTLRREAMTMTSATEYIMAVHHYGLTHRPVYRFTVQLSPMTRTQMDSLTALHARLQGGSPFFWDGGEFGVLENYQLVDEGNNQKTRVYLPNRYITANSFSLRTFRPSTMETSVWTTAFSLHPDAGLLTWTTAVRSGDEVQAKYACKYNVCFSPEGIRVEEIAAGVYRAEVVLTENALVGG